jgi:type II secretory pathway component PulJ
MKVLYPSPARNADFSRRGVRGSRRGRLKPAFRAAAFSLIEIMVAVGLLAFIIIGLVLTFNQVQRAFRSGTGQSDVLEGARAAMNVVTRDLQELSAYGGEEVTNFFTRAYPPTLQTLPSGDARTNMLCDLFFLSKRSDDYVVIAYRVDATNGLIGPLMRFETNVFTTNVYQVMAKEIGRWLAEFPSSRFHRVADNVVHFRITASDTNGILFSVTNNFNTNYLFIGALGDVYQFSKDALPAFVDVEMASMDPSAAAKLRIRADISASQGADYFRDRVGRVDVFRQRIPIRPAATQIRPPSS